MDYFRNEDEVVIVDGMTIQNGLDQVEVFGAITVVPGAASKAGLRRLIDALIKLEQNTPNAKLGVTPSDDQAEIEIVENPFL